MLNKFTPLLISSLLVLTACGGNDSNDSSNDDASGPGVSTTTMTVADPIDLTTADTDEVAAEATITLASTSVAAAKGVVPTQTTNNRIIGLVSDFSRQAKLRSKEVTTEEACEISGTYTFTVDTADLSVVGTYDNCSEFGEITNGVLAGTFETLDDDMTKLLLTFTGFSVISSGASDDFSMNMDGKMIVTSIDFDDYDRSVIDGKDMLIQMSYLERAISLVNYIITYDDYYFADPSYSISEFDYDMNSSKLGGSLHVTSTQAVYQNDSDEFPYAGQIKLSGSGNGNILITILSSTNITLATDVNGDGTYDASSNITWDELEDYLEAD